MVIQSVDRPTLARNSSCLWVTGTRIQFQLQLLDRNKLAVGFTLPRVVQECGVDLLQEYSDLISRAQVGVTTACPPTGQLNKPNCPNQTRSECETCPTAASALRLNDCSRESKSMQPAWASAIGTTNPHMVVKEKLPNCLLETHEAMIHRNWLQQIQHTNYWNKTLVKTLKLISANSTQKILKQEISKNWNWLCANTKHAKSHEQIDTHQNNQKHIKHSNWKSCKHH